MNWYLMVFKKFSDFSSRSRRKEYWYFALINFIISFALGFIDGLTGTTVGEMGIGILGGIYTLIVIIPGIAVSVRRLHDTGRSGWWLLLAFIPIIGAIVLLVFFVQDSKPGTNEYGPNPKEGGEEIAEAVL